MTKKPTPQPINKILVVEDSESHVFNYFHMFIQKGFLPVKFDLYADPQAALKEMLAALYKGKLVILEQGSHQVHFTATLSATEKALEKHRYKLALFDDMLRGDTSATCIPVFFHCNPESKIVLISSDLEFQQKRLARLLKNVGGGIQAYFSKKLLTTSHKSYWSNREAIWSAFGMVEPEGNLFAERRPNPANKDKTTKPKPG